MSSPASSSKGTTLPSVEDFLKTVLRSGLLDAAQLKAALQPLPPRHLAETQLVADHLVRTGKLSRFQAKKLLKGAARGLILGPYQVLAPVGKGGMGTVYLARDQGGGALVALKVLSPHKARREERMLTPFPREMALAQPPKPPPHIATPFAAGESYGIHYIAMEFIPGKSLYRLVADEGPLTVSRAARLTAEVASGLQHAHNAGMVHRDLKPSNILVTPHDHAKVVDLGLALIEGEQADPHIIGGGRDNRRSM